MLAGFSDVQSHDHTSPRSASDRLEPFDRSVLACLLAQGSESFGLCSHFRAFERKHAAGSGQVAHSTVSH